MSFRAVSRADFIIKICGITRLEDALAAVESGANALGFNFYPKSPRYIQPEKAEKIMEKLPEGVLKVGVFVIKAKGNEPAAGGPAVSLCSDLDVLQIHGLSDPSEISQMEKRIFVATSAACAGRFPNHEIIIDTSWGRGRLENWSELQALDRPFILSGGLTPENVVEAIGRLRPAGVDVCTGVESAPGVKDAGKMKEFVRHARRVLPKETIQ